MQQPIESCCFAFSRVLHIGHIVRANKKQWFCVSFVALMILMRLYVLRCRSTNHSLVKTRWIQGVRAAHVEFCAYPYDGESEKPEGNRVRKLSNRFPKISNHHWVQKPPLGLRLKTTFHIIARWFHLKLNVLGSNTVKVPISSSKMYSSVDLSYCMTLYWVYLKVEGRESRV
jgi:hypothetical protein